MSKEEILKQAIKEGKVSLRAKEDNKFAELKWYDYTAGEWKQDNVIVQDVLVAADNFEGLDNDTNVDGNNGKEVINNLNDSIYQNKQDITGIEDDLSNYYTKPETDSKLTGYYTKTETNTKLNDKVDREVVSDTIGSKGEVVNTTFSSGDSAVWLATQRPDGDVDAAGANRVEMRLQANYDGRMQALIRAGDVDNKGLTYVPDNGNSIVTKDYVDKTRSALKEELLAEIETFRGEIKSLKEENESLKKEIWKLR